MYQWKKINRFLQVCMDIADWTDDYSEKHENWHGGEMCDGIGLGCKAMTACLREGAKEIIQLQADYRRSVERRQFADMREQSTREFCKDVFGDEEPDTLCEELKEKIRKFVAELLEDDEE